MLTGFQFRGGLAALKIHNSALSKTIGISRGTITKLKKISNFEVVHCHSTTLNLIEEFFKGNNLRFAHRAEMSLMVDRSIYKSLGKLTVFQTRASRSVLNLSLDKLSKATQIKLNDLFNFEKGDARIHVISHEDKLNKLRKFYLEKGIFYPDDYSITINK